MPKIILKSKFSKGTAHTCNYLSYIHRQGDIFNDIGDVSVTNAIEETVNHSDSIMWHQVMSFKYEDIERLGLNQEYFQNLIAARKYEIAKAYNISPNNLQIYVSFHDKDFHPHLHMVFYSTNKNEGFVKGSAEDKEKGLKDASQRLKSLFANEIFKEDLHDLKVRKSDIRNQINIQVQETLREMTKKETVPKAIINQYKEIAKELNNHYKEHPTHRKAYMYLPPNLKKKIDELLENIVYSNNTITSSFERYTQYQNNLIRTYAENSKTVVKKLTEFNEHFFHPLKGDDTSRHNLIIQSIVGNSDFYGSSINRNIENKGNLTSTTLVLKSEYENTDTKRTTRVSLDNQNMDTTDTEHKGSEYRAKNAEEAAMSLTWTLANNLHQAANSLERIQDEPARRIKRRTFKKEENKENEIGHY